MKKPADNSKKPASGSQASSAFDPNGVIGRKLKSFYDVIETEQVPDKLLDLLEKLDEAERKTSG
ncbi:MAG: NepR family anti-sigma factor [Shinella sp.]|nr:NepR family anti-sigma factor [Shinella sp.]